MNRRTLLAAGTSTIASCVIGSLATPAYGEEENLGKGFKTLPDEKNYYKGPFGAYCSPFYRFYDKEIRHGIDYRDEMVIDEAKFPSNTFIKWQWPDHPPKTSTGVYGYMHVYLGNYSGGRPP